MSVVDAPVRRYPEGWPVAQREGYSGLIDAGLVRSQQRGFAQQWRFSPAGATRLAMTFRILRSEYPDWLKWINTYAITDWVLLPCVNQYRTIDPTPTYAWSLARFVGRMSVQPLGELYVDVRCAADVYPAEVGDSIDGTGVGGGKGFIPRFECFPYSCTATTEYFVSRNGVWSQLGTTSPVWADFPFPTSGGLQAYQDSRPDGLAIFNGDSIQTKTLPDDGGNYDPYFQFTGCEDNQQPLYLVMTDGNFVSAISPTYIRDPNYAGNGSGNFYALVGRETLGNSSSAFMGGEVFSTRLYGRLTTNVLTVSEYKASISMVLEGGTDNVRVSIGGPGQTYTLINPELGDNQTLSKTGRQSASALWDLDSLTDSTGVWIPLSVGLSVDNGSLLRAWGGTSTDPDFIVGTCNMWAQLGANRLESSEQIVFTQTRRDFGAPGFSPQELVIPSAYGLSASQPPTFGLNCTYALGAIGTSSLNLDKDEFITAIERNRSDYEVPAYCLSVT